MKLPETQSNERGVALLLTLGVLSLLLILTMSFAFTARTELLASEVNADMVKARLLCESGLERVLGFLSFSFDGDQEGDGFPATSPAGLFAEVSGRHIFLSDGSDDKGIEDALGTELANDFSFLADTTAADARWQHIEDEDENLIGRIAFAVVDESGKLDPTHVTSGSVDEGNEDRIGVSPDEINIGNALGMNDADAQKFRDDMHVNANRWFSWPHIIGRVSSVSSGNAVNDCKAIFPWSYDIEAWQDVEEEPSVARPRYDLDNLGAAEVDDLIAVATQDYFSSVPPPEATGIEWLTFLQPESARKQVAANLIDYCDADSYATNDYDGDKSYCGLEKVPYINELIVKAEVSEDVDGEGDTDGTYSLELVFKVEMANIYGGAISSGDVQVMFDLGDEDGVVTNADLSLNLDPADVSGYTVLETSQTYDMEDNNPLSNLAVNDIVIIAHDDADDNDVVSADALYDFAELGDSPVLGSLAEGATAQAFALEVADPRHNTASSEWTPDPDGWSAWDEADDADNVGSEGEVNANSDPFTDPDDLGSRDMEQQDDPVGGLSTAHIADGPMQNLWELGAIHRGEPWRTINLKAYNDGGDLSTTPGTYENGDGRILDQVKIGDQTEVYGRVNVNSPVVAVWAAALGRITIGGAYDNPSGGSPLVISGASGSANDAGELASAVVAGLGGSGTAWNGRGGLCSVSDLAGGTVELDAGDEDLDTDREQEEIIGKVAHLLTARQNYFNVIVVAQALQDIGNNESTDYVRLTKSDGSETNVNILAEQKIKAVVYRDAFRNEFEVKRYEFLED